MRRVAIGVAVLCLAVGSASYGQTTKIASADDFSNAMEAILFDFASANYSIVALAPAADAQKSVASTKLRMAAVEAFWTERKKDGPAKIARLAIEKLDAYEKTIAAGDRNEMAAAIKQVVAQCGACHNQYRDQDPVTKEYRIKPGVL